MDRLQELSQSWIEAKRTEKACAEERRLIEDEMHELLDIDKNLIGTKNLELKGYAIKITGRITQKVDSDLLQEIAAEHDLTVLLYDLFRWKPEINKTAWKNCKNREIGKLLVAVTDKPSRLSFFITEAKEDKENG